MTEFHHTPKFIIALTALIFVFTEIPVVPAHAATTGTITDWSRYSSTYFYDQMNTKEKELYDGLTKAANEAMNSTDYITDIEADYHDMTMEEYGRVQKVWLETEAQYFFIHGYGGDFSTTGTARMSVLPEYYDGKARQTARKKFEANIIKFTKQARKGHTQADKEKIIHDILVRRLKYGDSEDSFLDQTSASSLIGNETVCAGYAAAFSVLMNGIGVPTITLTDFSHAWNKVKLGKKWYLVDVTYDDPVGRKWADYPNGSNMTYDYFNVSDATTEYHDNDSSNLIPTSHKLTDWHGYKVPKCNEDRIILWGKQNFKVKKGSIGQIYFNTNSPVKKVSWKFSNKHASLWQKIFTTNALVNGNSKGKTTATATITYKNGKKRTRRIHITIR